MGVLLPVASPLQGPASGRDGDACLSSWDALELANERFWGNPAVGWA